MRYYETVFVIRQNASPTQVDHLAKQFAAVIRDLKGEVTKTELCGLRTLAYPIKKNQKGHYVLFNVAAEKDAIKEMERQMKISEDILRYLTIRVKELNNDPSPLMQQYQQKNENFQDTE
ncbi:MAG: 30S ribosomal protein S6 [Alphaproteobacteria bacterium]